jgi:hypothetical protein
MLEIDPARSLCGFLNKGPGSFRSRRGSWPFPKDPIFENANAYWSYVYELVRYALEPQRRDASHLHAPRAHGDVRPDDDNALLRGDERRHCDDALARDASAILPSLGSSRVLMEFDSNYCIDFSFLPAIID